jgi:hypothetical protein
MLQISLIVSVQNLTSKKYRYCKHLCKIDRPSKPVISDYDIWIIARIVFTSTYLEFDHFACILNISLQLSIFANHYMWGATPVYLNQECHL